MRQTIVELEPIYNEQECAQVIDWSERRGFAPWPTDSEISTLSRCVAEERLLVDLWNRLAPAIETATGQTPTRFAGVTVIDRFEVGQRLLPGSGGGIKSESEEKTKLTVVVFLNEEFIGGEIVCYPFKAPVTLVPRTGVGLAFAPYLVCEEFAIRAGRKYVLRSTVALETT